MISNEDFIRIVESEDKDYSIKIGDSIGSWVDYNRASDEDKQRYCLRLNERLELKYWKDVNCYWSVCLCRLFHEKYYEKLVVSDGYEYMGLVCRCLCDDGNNVVHYEKIK